MDLGQKQDPTALALVWRIAYRCAYGGPRFDGLGVLGLARVTQRMDLPGRVRVGAEALGEHDDLVMAVALAVWKAKRIFAVSGMTRLPGI